MKTALVTGLVRVVDEANRLAELACKDWGKGADGSGELCFERVDREALGTLLQVAGAQGSVRVAEDADGEVVSTDQVAIPGVHVDLVFRAAPRPPTERELSLRSPGIDAYSIPIASLT